MATSREGPNPLRPYYVPPSIHLPPDLNSTSSAKSQNAGSIYTSRQPTAGTSFGSSARDILSDLDYADYLSDSSPSALQVVKNLADQAVWKYTSVLMAQPFEVAKTILQVSVISRAGSEIADADNMRRRPEKYRDSAYDDFASDNSDPESPSYFTSSAPLPSRLSRSSKPRGRRRQQSSPSPSMPPKNSPHTLHPKDPTSVFNVVSELWATDGAWGIWKGTNSTFIYSVLYSTITTWTRSLLSALLSLPDPGALPVSFFFSQTMSSPVGGLDILSSPSPMVSLFVAVSASAVASILLAPFDIARTYLLLTPSMHPPRSLLPTLKFLPTWTLPFSVAPVTLLHSTLPTLFSAATPLFLRSRLGIDPLLTPNMYSIATFISQGLELGVRLPIETVLRRGQMAVINARPKMPATKAVETVTQLGNYKGLIGTMWHIISEEGDRGGRKELVSGTNGIPALRADSLGKKMRKGQGMQGLWRGWRIGVWGLVGVWGAAALGGSAGKGGEF